MLCYTSVIVFCLLALVAAALPPPPPHQNSELLCSSGSKAFVVGLPHTGAHSVGDVLARLLPCRRSESNWWTDLYSRYLYHMFAHNHTEPLVSHAHEYDILEGLPWAVAYRELAAAFPDAKFILTMYANESAWLEGIDRHTARRKLIGNKKIFGCKKVRSEECREKYLDAYRRHNEGVQGFFDREGRGRLLTMVVDGGDDAPTEAERIIETDASWISLIEFLGLEEYVERLGGWSELGLLFREGNDDDNVSSAGWNRIANVCEKGILRSVKLAVKVVKGLSFLTARGL